MRGGWLTINKYLLTTAQEFGRHYWRRFDFPRGPKKLFYH
jgi:hypothetical protein